ncbi:MAG: substrate-binding domain-containing protein [Planctomycetes bacterium]|nr:substrate-binding domain-containing protein [Planctomycetota bacterium]
MRKLFVLLAILLCSTVMAGDAPPLMKTIGPQGEEPTPHTVLELTPAQIEAAKAKKLSGVLLLHETSDYTNGIQAGVKDAFARCGVKLLVVTDAEMDSNKQRTDIETALALNPDILITLVIDPVSGAVALRQAVDQGVKIALVDNHPNGFVHGRDYAGIVSDDLFNMGKSVAELMAEKTGGKAKVAWIYHDADFYVTNQRDQAVRTVLKAQYPEMEIITERGIANPDDGEVLGGAILTQFPQVNAIYVPWDTIAEGVVAAARAAERTDVKIFTMDLGANNSLDMVKGGNVVGVVADLPYSIGESVANMGILAAMGVETPPFVVVPAIKIDKDNLVESWNKSLNRNPPKEVMDLVKK